MSIKKIFLILLSVSLAALLYFAVKIQIADARSCKEILFELLEISESDFEGKILLSDNNDSNVGEIFSALYGNSAHIPDYLNMTDEYAVYISKGFELFEIHIYHLKHISNVEEFKRMLKAREQIIKNSLLENTYKFEKYAKENVYISSNGIKIFSNGKFVFMLVAENCEELEGYLK